MSSNEIPVSAEELVKYTKLTFNTDNPTTAQMKYVMTSLVPSMYLLEHHRIHGHPITFNVPNRDITKAQSHRPWQIAILNDQHPNKVIIKSRQLGLSEIGVAEVIWFADRHSEDEIKALYTFPTNRQLDTFVKTRIDPQFTSGYYASIVDARKSSMKEKQLRDSFLIFRSSSKSGSVEGVDIDYLSLDEYDRVPSQAEDSAVESMASSKFKILRRWSTPSVPDYGIDKLFKKSDMKYYMHECTHCQYLNQMKYSDYNPNDLESSGNIRLINPDGINRDNGEIEDNTYDFVCQKCGKHLDRWYNGRWVALHPERKSISGYMISQMNAVWVTADALKRKEAESRSIQTFHNYVLGEPYQDLNMAVFDKDVYGNLSEFNKEPSYNRDDYSKIAVGIDWGTHENHIVVMGLNSLNETEIIRLIRINVDNNYNNINGDINKTIVEIAPYKPDIILADLGYNGTKVNRLLSEFGAGKVFGVNVNPARSKGEVMPVFSEAKYQVTIDKLTNNLFFINQLKSGNINLWNNPKDSEIQRFTEHWKAVVIRDVEDDDTGEIYKEITRKGADHYAQSAVYALVGMRKLVDEQNNERRFSYSELEADTSGYYDAR